MLKSLYNLPVVIYKGIVINAGRHLVEKLYTGKFNFELYLRQKTGDFSFE